MDDEDKNVNTNDKESEDEQDNEANRGFTIPNGKTVELHDIVAEVLEIEKEINAEASNIVHFSSQNISSQPLFLQPIEIDEVGNIQDDFEEATEDSKLLDISDFENEAEVQLEIDSSAACLEQIMPKTQSEVEFEESAESDSELDLQSEENSCHFQLLNSQKSTFITESTDSELEHFTAEDAKKFCVVPRVVSGVPSSLEESDEMMLDTDVDTSASFPPTTESDYLQSDLELGADTAASCGGDGAAENVVSAIINDVLSQFDNKMSEGGSDDEAGDCDNVNYSASAAAAGTADPAAASLEAGPGPVAVSPGLCQHDSRNAEDDIAARPESRDESPQNSLDWETAEFDPEETMDNHLEDREYSNERVELRETEINEIVDDHSRDFEKVPSDEVTSVEEPTSLLDKDDTEVCMAEHSPTAMKLAQLKDWLECKEKEVNDILNDNSDQDQLEDLQNISNIGTTEVEDITNVQKDFNIQAEILKQLTESILASSKMDPVVEKSQQPLSGTGEMLLDSSSVLITPLTKEPKARSKSGKHRPETLKKSVKSPLLRRKEIRTCINLHNDCENSDVLHEIMTPAMNFGSTTSTDVNTEAEYPETDQEVASPVPNNSASRSENFQSFQVDNVSVSKSVDVSCNCYYFNLSMFVAFPSQHLKSERCLNA